MFHACVQRFDVTGTIEFFLELTGPKGLFSSLLFFFDETGGVSPYWL